MQGVLFALLLVLSPQAASAAGIYKWVDADGVTHYSESSPENAPAREVEIEPPPVVPSVEQQQRLRQIEQSYDELSRELASQRQARQQRRQAEAEAQRDRRERCGHALIQLRVLEKAQPVYRDEDGNLHTQRSSHSSTYKGRREYLDDETRKMETIRFQQVVSDSCDNDESLEQRALEQLLADYHRRQCKAARELLVELTRAGVDRRSQDRIGVEQDVDRHCFRVGRR